MRMYLLREVGSPPSPCDFIHCSLASFLGHLGPYYLCSVDWVGRWKPRREVPGSPFHIFSVYFPSFFHVTKFLLTLLLSSLWMTAFVKLTGMPRGRDAMQKKIIVLHNCPVLRDASSPLAQEQTLLSGRSYESRAQCIWEVALSSTPVPWGWPLPQLW